MPETQEPEHVLFSVLAMAILPPASQRPAAQPVPPRLVISLAIDQLRPEYLDLGRAQFRGGLSLMLREGVFYANGEQDHASEGAVLSEVAPHLPR